MDKFKLKTAEGFEGKYEGDLDHNTPIEFTSQDGVKHLSVSQLRNHQKMLRLQIEDLERQEKEAVDNLKAAEAHVKTEGARLPKKPAEKKDKKAAE